jgi:hypothetical protein
MRLRMTYADVQALGWIFTRDVLAGILRGAFGLRRRFAPAALLDMGERWRALQKELDRGPAAAQSLFYVLRREPVPAADQKAVRAFVSALTQAWPRRYGGPALARRLRDAWTLVAVGFTGATLLGAVSEAGLGADMALVLLVMALWNVACATQVLRLYSIVRDLEPATAGIEAPKQP